MLLIYGDEKVWQACDEEEATEAYERHNRFIEMLTARGALVHSEELGGTGTARTVRNGDAGSVTDGPFAETAEQLGGYYLIEAADMDEAVEIARQLPEPTVEIRPVVDHS